ncbi:MAG: alpha-rhamnosidase [Erysipelotrichaceae bacterium]|nr:alpha-rhamnosidase [Erysipelotrichaceae bacterium]
MCAKWIWYPGDFELYHNLVLHSRREEYDYAYPVMWHIERPQSSCCFSRQITLQEASEIIVYAHGKGYVRAGNQKIGAVGKPLRLPAGTYVLSAEVVCLETFPSVFIDTPEIATDETWVAHFNGAARKYADCSPAFACKDDDPAVFPFSYKEIRPVSQEEISGHILYDFGLETFGPLHISRTKEMGQVDIFYGESREEALDEEYAYLREHIPAAEGTYTCKARAFRFVYIKAERGVPGLTAEEEFLPAEDIASFVCDDEKLGRIWEICARAFHLNAREFYLDGIKRDRWVWSGDAYQSYMVGRYLINDRDITRRTIRALLGRAPYFQHINTISDYSMYMFPAVKEYFEASGDEAFVISVREELLALYHFITSRLDEQTGYVIARPGDWIFIDWAEMDKQGPVCAEQILLYQVYKTMEVLSPILQTPDPDFGSVGMHHYAAGSGTVVPFAEKEETEDYAGKAQELRASILKDFWDPEKHAFIDTYASGKNHVSRHANIFAILYDLADHEMQEEIAEYVLHNDAVAAITTPYFKLYELMALARTGRMAEVQDYIDSYWGGMVDNGATSAWEEYDPRRSGTGHYEMYGDKYGCSLCHAWGSGPIYLLTRFCAGVYPTSPGAKTFAVAPEPGRYTHFTATVPIGSGKVEIRYEEGHLSVKADIPGGILYWKGQEIPLPEDIRVQIG